MSISAISADVPLKNWFLHLIVRMNLYVLPAVMGILAGLCLRFRVDHLPGLGIWAVGCHRHAHHPPVVSPEPLSSITAVSCARKDA